AEDGAADTLQRAGADKPGGLPRQVGPAAAQAETARSAGPQDLAGLCLYRLAEVHMEVVGQALFLPLKGVVAAPGGESPAEDEKAVLADGPGGAGGGGRIKDAGVKRVLLRQREPLLNGGVPPGLDGGEEAAAHQGAGPVSPNQGGGPGGLHSAVRVPEGD